jgi:hypothetical protein
MRLPSTVIANVTVGVRRWRHNCKGSRPPDPGGGRGQRRGSLCQRPSRQPVMSNSSPSISGAGDSGHLPGHELAIVLPRRHLVSYPVSGSTSRRASAGACPQHPNRGRPSARCRRGQWQAAAAPWELVTQDPGSRRAGTDAPPVVRLSRGRQGCLQAAAWKRAATAPRTLRHPGQRTASHGWSVGLRPRWRCRSHPAAAPDGPGRPGQPRRACPTPGWTPRPGP